MWRGSFFGSMFLVASILAFMIVIASSNEGDGPVVYALLKILSGLIFPLLLIAFWIPSGCILSLTTALIDAKRPLYFSLSSIAIAALIGLILDFLFNHGQMGATILLLISVAVSTATVVFLNRQSAKA
jgi:hypothetical protein